MDNDLTLSDTFSYRFNKKYYSSNISMKDLSNLSISQLEELEKKDIKNHSNDLNVILLESLGLIKLVDFYKKRKKDYNAVDTILNYDYLQTSHNEIENIVTMLKYSKEENIKDICFDYLRKHIIETEWNGFKSPDKFEPKIFVKENKDLFLIDVDIPRKIKQHYYDRNLDLQDLMKYIDIFDRFPIDNFMWESSFLCAVKEQHGIGKFQKLAKKHPDVFKHIMDSYDQDIFSDYLFDTYNKDLEENFIRAVKKYLFYCKEPHERAANIMKKNPLKWLESMNFTYVNSLTSLSELLNYNSLIFILSDKPQQEVIDTLGIENIKKIEEETNIFSSTLKNDTDFDMKDIFSIIRLFLDEYDPEDFELYFKHGTLPYEEFRNEFAYLLNVLRSENYFKDSCNYDFIQGKFREEHPEIFMDINAPEELKEAFYNNEVTAQFLYNHKEYIPYLIDKEIDICTDLLILYDEDYPYGVFVDEYTKRYGKEKLLNLIVKYGDILEYVVIKMPFDYLEDEEKIEKEIIRSIYMKIFNNMYDYRYLGDVKDFASTYKELFIDFKAFKGIEEKEIKRLENAFYKRELTFEDIKKYPQLIEVLKDKNLEIPFAGSNNERIHNDHYLKSALRTDLEIKDIYGNENFLILCSKYGNYMKGIVKDLIKEIYIKNGKYYDLESDSLVTFDNITKKIEKNIAYKCINGIQNYSINDAPEFLNEQYPELFLSVDAPQELKEYFYSDNIYKKFTFDSISSHRKWLPYLKGKIIKSSLIRDAYDKDSMAEYFLTFGDDVAIKLGINKPETVEKMITSRKIYLMKDWYDRTGGKFIPDIVVMQNFPLEEADKFFLSASSWSKLMKLKDYSTKQEPREALLKLAYTFGVFDNDQKGFHKLKKLLTNLPKKITNEDRYELDRYNKVIDEYSNRSKFYSKEKTNDEILTDMIFFVKENFFVDIFDAMDLADLLESIKKDKMDIDLSKEIFTQLYRKNEDSTYTLIFNTQKYPNVAQAIRHIFVNRAINCDELLTSTMAHQIFGGFKLKYDPEFREFLLSNMREILSEYDSDYSTYIPSIQKQFKAIKRANINRKLTLDLAISYVQSNKYENVELGNEKVAEISAIAGYTQEDFDTLQKIYNHGKQRVFSSIPRIEGSNKKYTYEMLRLDDPLAMAIGTLTNCCQEIGNMAEVCMEHSMVDENGRVFVIRDSNGNIVSQSWVWRNKDVLCFDNIEIPNKAFARVDDRKKFTDEIYEIYKQAAGLLIEQDEKEYKKLFDDGKITQEQYEGLILRKITVGIGYNDIADSLKEKSKLDEEDITRPLPFHQSVDLDNNLYLNDSKTQYILDETHKKSNYSGRPLYIYNDTYTELDDSNFNKNDLLFLEEMEENTKYEVDKLDICYYEEDSVIKQVANNYDLNPKTTKIIMNPNFVIIYDIINNTVRIGDLLFNTQIENDEQNINIEDVVVMQIRLALEQIGKDRQIDISKLEDNQKEIYNKAMNLKDEIDIAKGIKIK